MFLLLDSRHSVHSEHTIHSSSCLNALLVSGNDREKGRQSLLQPVLSQLSACIPSHFDRCLPSIKSSFIDSFLLCEDIFVPNDLSILCSLHNQLHRFSLTHLCFIPFLSIRIENPHCSFIYERLQIIFDFSRSDLFDDFKPSVSR